jgi:NADH:ubiquinone oxidoreductase subunit 6 (subunit J)
MSLIRFLFDIMGFIAIASAIFVAATNNFVRSIFMFFITLLALAGLYVLALADFVAITQVIIYVGGILVLILFAFMLSGRETLNAIAQRRNKFISVNSLPALVLSGLFLVVMLNVVFKVDANNLAWIKNSVELNNDIMVSSAMTENIGVNLMTRYLLPFEAISVLLMVALIGAAHLSRKEAGS